jgi:uncharacterized protein HemX
MRSIAITIAMAIAVGVWLWRDHQDAELTAQMIAEAVKLEAAPPEIESAWTELLDRRLRVRIAPNDDGSLRVLLT